MLLKNPIGMRKYARVVDGAWREHPAKVKQHKASPMGGARMTLSKDANGNVPRCLVGKKFDENKRKK